MGLLRAGREVTVVPGLVDADRIGGDRPLDTDLVDHHRPSGGQRQEILRHRVGELGRRLPVDRRGRKHDRHRQQRGGNRQPRELAEHGHQRQRQKR